MSLGFDLSAKSVVDTYQGVCRTPDIVCLEAAFLTVPQTAGYCEMNGSEVNGSELQPLWSLSWAGKAPDQLARARLLPGSLSGPMQGR